MIADRSDDAVVIRRAESPADYRACQDAQRRAWGIVEDGYLVPIATLVGANLHGGLVLGAFRPDGTAAGLSFAFPARIEGEWGLYSQLTGVVPDYQGKGLGRRLKQVQFDYARREGFSAVAWAFDPLRSGNARFNLDALGAAATHYYIDMYGPRTDALNAGTPTDRLLAVWRPDAPPRAELPTDPLTLPFVVDGPEPIARPLDPSAPLSLLEIPDDLDAVRAADPERANRWRLAVRDGFAAAFAAGLRAVGTHRTDPGNGSPRRCFYVLGRGD